MLAVVGLMNKGADIKQCHKYCLSRMNWSIYFGDAQKCMEKSSIYHAHQCSELNKQNLTFTCCRSTCH